jgi:DNA (cytosine-5)-methyltransferase 1
MKHLDLFSGIGGFALAASWVWGEDHEIVSFCEIEDYPQRVLKKHWPDVPCHGNIKTLKGDSFGTIDLITGGFPCQPFSTAGKQGGSSDDRYLWPEMLRVIQEAKPTWVIGENVAGLINMVEFEQCFLDLESEGYETQAFIIPACAKDAKHRRDRVWIVAHSESTGTGGNIRWVRGLLERCCEGPEGLGQKDVADSERQRQPRQGEHARRMCEKAGGPGKANRIINNGKRTGGPWEPEPPVGRVANGIPSRVDRLKGLGNAIVPQVVVPIMQAIKECSKFQNIE